MQMPSQSVCEGICMMRLALGFVFLFHVVLDGLFPVEGGSGVG
jgi:hypothetical protein